MGQFLPEVRGVFKLIEVHQKDLERAINEKGTAPKKESDRHKNGERGAGES